jgi:hypothetical protein
LHSIKLVKQLAPAAPVWDMTDTKPAQVFETQLA